MAKYSPKWKRLGKSIYCLSGYFENVALVEKTIESAEYPFIEEILSGKCEQGQAFVPVSEVWQKQQGLYQ